MKLIKILIFLTCLSTLQQAESKDISLTLPQAIERCLANNFQIKISRKQSELTNNNNNWGAAGKLPTITASFSQNNSWNNIPGDDNRITYLSNTLVPNINLSWTLFSGYSISLTKEKLEMLNNLSVGNASIAVENAIQSTILAYYRVLLEEERLNVMETVMTLSKDRYDYELTRQELGVSVTYDVLQAETVFLSDQANYIEQKLSLANAKRSLSLILGEQNTVIFSPTDRFEGPVQTYDWDTLITEMTKNNHTLKNQYINQNILKKEIGLAESSRYPTLSLNSGINVRASRLDYNGLPSETSTSYDYYLNFTLRFNVYNGGNIKRAIENARINEKIGQLKLEEMSLSLTNSLRNSFEDYTIQKEILKVAEQRVKSAALHLEISEDKFKTGSINSFNYRDVQLTYLNAALSRLQAIFNLINSHTELIRLTGGIITE